MTIAYEVKGTGDPILFIHGLGCGRNCWGPLPDLISETHSVILFDNRGIGQSTASLTTYSTRQMAEDTLSILDTLDIKKAHIFGVSLGGMIAQELAINNPSRVDKLILGCTTPGGLQAYPPSNQTLLVYSKYFLVPSYYNLRQIIKNSLSDKTLEYNSGLVDDIWQARNECSITQWTYQKQLVAAFGHDSSSNLKDIKSPTLVIYGEQDKVVDPANSLLLADKINCNARHIKNAGHLFFWEQPEQTARLIEEFLTTEV